MRSVFLSVLVLGLIALTSGCSNDVVKSSAPAAPQGVHSVTGDRAVYVYFDGPYESDIDHYSIWRSLDSIHGYRQIGEVVAEANPNLDLIRYEYIDRNVSNGTTYYYAVMSVDVSGRESELSAEKVYDTPRPEGIVRLFAKQVEPTLSGFSFADSMRVRWNSVAADVFVDTFNAVFYLNVADTLTDIQDMGYRDTLSRAFDDVSWAPASGWSKLGFLELIPGHTYVVWTRDDHYAKMRVKEMYASGPVTFQWAYQTSRGNPELAPAVNPLQKPSYGSDFMRHSAASNSTR